MVRAPRRAYSSLGEHLILHSHADLGQEQESACCHLHELFIYKISGCYCPAPWLAARQRLLTHGSAQHLPLQPGSCQLPQDPIPPQLSTGHCIFAAKIPLTSFFFFFSVFLQQSLSAQKWEQCCCEARSWCFIPLQQPPLGLCYSRRRESRISKFSLMGRGMEVPSFAKHRLGNE